MNQTTSATLQMLLAKISQNQPQINGRFRIKMHLKKGVIKFLLLLSNLEKILGILV